MHVLGIGSVVEANGNRWTVTAIRREGVQFSLGTVSHWLTLAECQRLVIAAHKRQDA